MIIFPLLQGLGMPQNIITRAYDLLAYVWHVPLEPVTKKNMYPVYAWIYTPEV